MHSVQLWELACLRRRPASRPISFGCTQSNCGSELAREGGLPADPYLSDALSPIVGARLAREGGLPANPSLSDARGPMVGAGMPAKAACHPTHIFRMHSVQLWERGLLANAACQPANPSLLDALSPIVGARLAREGGLTADLSISDALSPIVGASLLAKTP